MSKRVMLLGGSKFIVPAIDILHDLGYEVITCDYLPNNLAHKYSDRYENLSVVDKESVLKAACDAKIEGIMSFACDPGVATAAYVAQQMGLPSVGPYESVCILQNKKKFRRFLSENGFNCPTSGGFRSMSEASGFIDRITYPVIVKPADSAGSKGVNRVDDNSGLKSAVKKALERSIAGEFIIEEYLEQKGNPSDSECFSVDGDMKFVSFSSQYFDSLSSNPYGPVGFTWRPTISEDNRKELTDEISRLIRLLGMNTSLYNAETRECIDGKAYIMELSPRGGGNRLAEMIRYATGIDLIKAAVCAALGRDVDLSATKKDDGLWAEVILHGRKSGRYNGLLISDEIKKYVVETDIWVTKGENVMEYTGADRTLGTLILHFDDPLFMETVMDDPAKHINVDIG